MSTCTEKQYRLKFKGLVARLSQRLDAKNHESLRYVYCEQLRPCEPGETGILVALEELERHRIFSYDQPEKFAEILREVGREDCCEEVKIFIREHSDIIRRLQVRVQKDGSYSSALSQQQTRLPSTTPQDDDYCRFIPRSRIDREDSHSYIYHVGTPHTGYSEGSSSPSESPPSSLSNTSLPADDDDEDYAYAYVQVPILQSMPAEPKPLLEQTMRLISKPARTLIRQKQRQTVSSDVIRHSTSNSRFELSFDLMGYDSTSISGCLKLLEGSRLRSDILLQAELTVREPKSKRTKPERSPKYIHRTTVLMDIPHTKRHSAIVAKFPNIISHRNFLSSRIVRGPFLELKLVVREY